MTFPDQLLYHGFKHLVFDQHAIAPDVAESWSVDRLLQAHPEIEQIRQHPHVSVRLHRAPDHAKRHEELAVLEHHRSNDRAERALAGLRARWVIRLEGDARSAALD